MAQRSPITTHVLNTTTGQPAASVKLALHILSPSSTASTASQASPSDWQLISTSITDSDGRCGDLLAARDNTGKILPAKTIQPLAPGGLYRLTFETEEYFARTGTSTFFPFVQIHFRVTDPPAHHYHVPLLISPYSYSTYRGS